MKYIIYDCSGLELPILFPCFWNHKDIFEALEHLGGKKIISSGFLKINDLGELYVTGKSVTLGTSSREGDLEIIKRHLAFNM